MSMRYPLYYLNCDEFENLVILICNHILGSATIPFAKGKDGGKDGKFIDFEMDLDEGFLSGDINTRFDYYFNCFNFQNDATTEFDVDEFKNQIFKGIDMRGKIEIIDKCFLLHNLLNKDNDIIDYSFMCVEVAFMVLKYWGIDLQAIKPQFNIYNVFEVKPTVDITGLDYLNELFSKGKNNLSYYVRVERGLEYINRKDIWGVILSSYRYVVGYTKDNIDYDNYKSVGLRNYSSNFKNLMYVIN